MKDLHNECFLQLLFVWHAAELSIRAVPVRDCSETLEVTLPPETWALSFTTDSTGTLSIPLLNTSIICCIHKAFFNKASCETNLLSICPV